MKDLINRVQQQLDDNHAVEAEDIQELLNANSAKDDFIEAVLLHDSQLMIERFKQIEKYYIAN